MKLAKRTEADWLAQERLLLAATRQLIVEDGLPRAKDSSLLGMLLQLRARSMAQRHRRLLRTAPVGVD